MAEEFLKSLAGTILDPDQHMDFAKKIAMERLGNGFIKFAGLTDKEQRKLDKLAAAAIEEGFNAGLAKGRG